MERFVIIVNGFQPLTIITKRSILNVTAALDLPLTVLVVFRGNVFSEPGNWLTMFENKQWYHTYIISLKKLYLN